MSAEINQAMLEALKKIEQRAQRVYAMRPGHDEEIVMIGMIAESAIAKAREVK